MTHPDVSLLVTGDLHLGRHPSAIPEQIDRQRFPPGRPGTGSWNAPSIACWND